MQSLGSGVSAKFTWLQVYAISGSVPARVGFSLIAISPLSYIAGVKSAVRTSKSCELAFHTFCFRSIFIFEKKNPTYIASIALFSCIVSWWHCTILSLFFFNFILFWNCFISILLADMLYLWLFQLFGLWNLVSILASWSQFSIHLGIWFLSYSSEMADGRFVKRTLVQCIYGGLTTADWFRGQPPA